MSHTAVLVAFIAAFFPTVGIVATAYFQYKASQKADVKLDEIHTLTNDNFSKATEKIDRLEKIIKGLNADIKADKKDYPSKEKPVI